MFGSIGHARIMWQAAITPRVKATEAWLEEIGRLLAELSKSRDVTELSATHQQLLADFGEFEKQLPTTFQPEEMTNKLDGLAHSAKVMGEELRSIVSAAVGNPSSS